MHSLVAPILAQVLTVGAGARTEVRDVIELGQQHLEGSASAGVGASFTMPFLYVAAGYSPEVEVDPLESTPREVTVTDNLNAYGGLRHTFEFRQASLSLSQTGGYRVQNPALRALSPPPPGQPALDPGGAPEPVPPDGTEAADARRAEDFRVQTWTARTSAEFERVLGRGATFNVEGGYSFEAGLGESRASNPLIQGPDAGVSVGFQVTRRDELTTFLDGQYRWNELGNHGQVVVLGERWGHEYSRRTNSEIGIGVSHSREWINDGPVRNSIFPAGLANISYNTRFARGRLEFSGGVAAAPVLDVTTAQVDPRLGVGARMGWTRRRWTVGASIGSSVSFADDPDSAGALNSLFANAFVAYDLGAGFSADAGVRSAWESFEGVTVVNPQSAIFIGLSWGAGVTLIEARTTATPRTPRREGTTAPPAEATPATAPQRAR